MQPFALLRKLPEHVQQHTAQAIRSTTGRGVGICLLLTLMALPLLPQPAVATAGLGVFGVSAWLFVRRLGRAWPVRELAWLVACLQWLAGPFLSFYLFPPNEAALIEVGDEAYFAYALPGTLAYGAGLLIWPVRRTVWADALQPFRTRYPVRWEWALPLLGLAGYGLRYSGWQTGLFFVYVLMGMLLVVAAARWVLTTHPYRLWWAALCLVPLVVLSIYESMFMDVVLVCAFLGMLWWLRVQPGRWLTAGLVLGGVLAVLTLETLKQEYRNRTLWNAQDYNYTLADKLRVFPQLWTHYASRPDALLRGDNIATRLPRFSHAWLISQYMAHTPDCEPYALGETYWAGWRSLLPRVLAPGKKTVGGLDTYPRFSGQPNPPATSLSLTHLGEAYVNFGPRGGVVAMWGVGLLFGGLFAGFAHHLRKFPVGLPWIPFVFLWLPVAEVDLGMVLNYTFKASIIYGAYLLLTQYIDQNNLFGTFQAKPRQLA